MATRTGDNELVSHFVDAVSKGDNARLEGLKYAHAFLSLHHNALTEQRKWLTKKYGKKYSGLEKLDRELNSGALFAQVLNAEIQHTAATPSTFNRTGWRVHGRVFDKAITPVEGIVVSLSGFDLNVSAETDKAGYYSLILDSRQVEELHGGAVIVGVPQVRKQELPTEFSLIPIEGNSDYLDIQLPK